MDLNACIKTEIIKSVEENTGVNIDDLQFGQDLISVTLGVSDKRKGYDDALLPSKHEWAHFKSHS